MADKPEDTKDEEWKEHPEFPGYLISTLGRVYREKTNHYIKLTPDKGTGYININLRKDNKTIRRGAHQLVAVVWIPNPENKPEVNHINHDVADNRRENLEWVTKRENNQKRRIDNPNATSLKRKVVQIGGADDGSDLIWDSIEEAAEVHDIHPSGISAVCRGGKQKTSAGFRWEYLDDYKDPPEDEQWRPFDHEGKTYQISSYGRVKLTHGGYTYGKETGQYLYFYTKLVHKLVLDTFDPSETDGDALVVHHVNNNKHDNRLVNLKRITQQENIQNAHDSGQCSVANAARERAVISEKNGAERKYKSVTEAAEITGSSKTKIVAVCKGKRLSTNGYHWRYEVPDEPTMPPVHHAVNYTLDDLYGEISAISDPILDDDPFWDDLFGETPAIPDQIVNDDPLWAELGI